MKKLLFWSIMVVSLVVCSCNKTSKITITYTSSDGKIIEVKQTAFDAEIVSNTYKNGEGKIVFETMMTSIEESAFSGCKSLTSVTIPNSVTSIGKYAFDGCSSLTSVTIGNGVTSIEESAFYDCESLTSINVDSNNPNYSSVDGVLFNKDKTTLVAYPGGKQGAYTIPNSVTSIGEGAFYGTSIYNNAANWKNGALYINNCLIKAKGSISGAYAIKEGTRVIASNAFKHCEFLTSITIPNSVTSIGDYAFWFCSSLTSITIPNSVTSIGNNAFGGCSKLTSITIPNSVTSIGEEAFIRTGIYTNAANWKNGALYINNCLIKAKGSISGAYSIKVGTRLIANGTFNNCSSLRSITIPNSVTSIGDEAFYDCESLTSITIPNSVTSIGKYAFAGCSSLASITIPNSVTSIGNNAFGGCSKLTSITIPNSVTSIRKYAFDGCKSLTSIHVDSNNPNYSSVDGVLFNKDKTTLVAYPGGKQGAYTIPNSVTSIKERAFYDCESLTSITIPNSVTSIGKRTFLGCESLTSVTIPNSVTSIGYEAFSYCFSLTSVTIGNGVTSIGESAFSGCYSLASVTIGNSVTSIRKYAFDGCKSLTSVEYNGTKEQWNKIELHKDWAYNTNIELIHCTDGEIRL